MEAKEEKRQAYQESIKNILPQSLVYIDESGIELNACKDRGWGKNLLVKKVESIMSEQTL